MNMEAVASFLGKPAAAIRQLVTGLAAAGVLFELGRRLAVRPAPLGHALVRDVFFIGPSRRALVPHLPRDVWPPQAVTQIIGNDEEAFRLLLARSGEKRLHLSALHGDPDDGWVAKAVMALDAGCTPEEVGRRLGRTTG